MNEAGRIILDEFEATLSGLTGNIQSLESADGRIRAAWQMSDDETERYRNEDGDPYSADEFNRTSRDNSYARRLADLPFTLTLSADKTKVIMSLKERLLCRGLGIFLCVIYR